MIKLNASQLKKLIESVVYETDVAEEDLMRARSTIYNLEKLEMFFKDEHEHNAFNLVLSKMNEIINSVEQ